VPNNQELAKERMKSLRRNGYRGSLERAHIEIKKKEEGGKKRRRLANRERKKGIDPISLRIELGQSEGVYGVSERLNPLPRLAKRPEKVAEDEKKGEGHKGKQTRS